ncbi:IS4 family transposase [Roseibacillus persicicus]|uniref:IS4 family transposase n=1 Tax=Roseibacillus persicicus TaxID=454148 RepID=UPI00398B5047
MLFEDVLPSDWLTKIDPTKRQRQFGHIPTLWAWTCQIFERNESCSRGLAHLQSWAASEGLPVPAGDSGAYCRARMRLKDDFIEALSQRTLAAMDVAIDEENRWQGFELKAIDGSSVKLMDTPENQEQYPQPSVQKEGCGFPVMSVSALLNLSHGGIEHFVTGPLKEQDASLARQSLEHLHEGDLLLADRAYSSFRLISEIRKQGAHCVMRLNSRRDEALDWRKGKRVGRHERVLTLSRPAFSRTGITGEQWENLPEELTVRIIRMNYEDRAGKKKRMTIVTTLIDSSKYDGMELHSLYAKRWEIEVRLRDIKTLLGFEMLRVRTPSMARKTLAMVRLSYNLLRCLMQRAARTSPAKIDEISFKGALDLVSSGHDSFRKERGRPRKRRWKLEALFGLIAGREKLMRLGRSEPRAVKGRPKPFSLLTSHRHVFQEIPHRSSYRKPA